MPGLSIRRRSQAPAMKPASKKAMGSFAVPNLFFQAKE